MFNAIPGKYAKEYQNVLSLTHLFHLHSKMHQTWSRGYKTFFMLNSVKPEILNGHKYKNIKKKAFLVSDKSRMLFIPLINVKMPTIVGF